jgi:hypothetical protein
MARPVSIPIVSDVAGFLRGTKDVEGALDDVADSLDDLSREAQNAGDDAGRALSDGIEDGARDAEKALDDVGKSDGLDRVGENAEQAAKEVETAAEKMERSFKDAFDTAKKESDGASKKIGTDSRKGFDDASEGAREFKDEANSTARESAASFDGSAASITDTFQEIAANAFAGFGPAGAAAGLAAAAGIGLVVSAFDKSKERAQELRDRIGEIRDGLVAVRVDGEPALGQVAERIRDIISETDEGAVNLDKLTDAAEGLSKVDFQEFLRGVAGGDPATLEGLIKAEEDYQAALRRTGEDSTLLGKLLFQRHTEEFQNSLDRQKLLEGEQEALSAADTERLRQSEEILAAEEERAAKTEETNARIEELRGTHDERLQQARETNQEREDDAQQARVDAAAEADQQIAEGVLSLTDAYAEVRDAAIEDGEITASELIGILDQQIADQDQRIRNWAWAGQNLTATQRQVLIDMGEDGQAALEGLVNTTPELRAEALARLTTVGERKGTAEANGVVTGLERTLPATVEGPNVRVSVDDTAWVRWANEVSRRGVTVPLRVVRQNQAV